MSFHKKFHLLIQIIVRGDLNELQKELSQYPQLISECDQDGRAALHHTCIVGNMKMAKVLVFKGVNINQKALNGCSPLHFACYQGYTNIALMLIAQGARLHARTDEGYSPILLACHSGHLSMALDLIRVGANLNDEDIYRVSALDSYGDGTDKSSDMIEQETLLLKNAYARETQGRYYESAGVETESGGTFE